MSWLFLRSTSSYLPQRSESRLPPLFISEELKDYLLGERAINKIFTLGNSDFPVSWENEIKLWTFLETRAALLLKTYKTTSEVGPLAPLKEARGGPGRFRDRIWPSCFCPFLQEDRSILEKPDLSLHTRLAVQLRLAEKQILENASASGRAKRLQFQEKLNEGAPLPQFEESDIALLENHDPDAKLPVILHKLEEVEEGQGIEEEEPLLNGGKGDYGMGTGANGKTVLEKTPKVLGDVGSGLIANGSSEQKGVQEAENCSASRTEDRPIDASA